MCTWIMRKDSNKILARWNNSEQNKFTEKRTHMIYQATLNWCAQSTENYILKEAKYILVFKRILKSFHN